MKEKTSSLAQMGWTPVTLQIAKNYGHVLVDDGAEVEFYREWASPCQCMAESSLCNHCTARRWLAKEEER